MPRVRPGFLVLLVCCSAFFWFAGGCSCGSPTDENGHFNENQPHRDAGEIYGDGKETISKDAKPFPEAVKEWALDGGDAGVEEGVPKEEVLKDGSPLDDSPDTKLHDQDHSRLGGPFRYGVNLGHRNPSWGDDKAGLLASKAGCNSSRVKLPAGHLEKWGYGIEVNDMKSYAANGLKNQVGFLIGAIAKHSTAPTGTPTWKLEYYIPKNLYKPITINGKINPENYWGHYVYKTVMQYKQWIKLWEIWNEPDWVSDWRISRNWTSSPPKASELPRFNGSIFDYIRMLRVSSVAAKMADPKALIALGGIGYPSFLSAILRYTDEPKAGKVTSDYPKRGGAYFDVLNIHYYPVFSTGNSDVGVDGFLKQRKSMGDELAKAGIKHKLWNGTETGAPHVKITGKPGGADYARNYLIKIMVTAQSLGFLGLDWFILSDGAKPGASKDVFHYMGLYFDIKELKTTAEAKKTDTGIAYTTLGMLFGGARFDATATTALALPKDVKGAAFVLADGRQAMILWAYDPSKAGEDAKSSYSLSTNTSHHLYRWDYSRSQKKTKISPQNGAMTLALTSSPSILISE